MVTLVGTPETVHALFGAYPALDTLFRMLSASNSKCCVPLLPSEEPKSHSLAMRLEGNFCFMVYQYEFSNIDLVQLSISKVTTEYTNNPKFPVLYNSGYMIVMLIYNFVLCRASKVNPHLISLLKGMNSCTGSMYHSLRIFFSN